MQYTADRFATGGTQNTSTDPIAGLDDGNLFQSERYGVSTYDIPVSNATYDIQLHFVEMYQENPGLRSFNVSIEGQKVIANLDIFSLVGHDRAYSVIINNIKVSDGKLTIATESITHNPTISGFAIYSNNGGTFIEPPVVANNSVCPIGSACKILPLGDSITEGVDGNNPSSSNGGYRVELFKKAVDAGKNITFVGSKQNGPTTVAGRTFPKSHEGYSGWTIDELSAKVPSPALNGHPNIVLLHIGTNNFWKTPNEVSSSHIKLGNLIDKIFKAEPNTLIVVASVIRYFGQETAYNQKIPAVVKQRADMGFKIIFVDQNAAFPNSGFGGDSVHPTTAGYAIMANTWYKAIEKYLN